MSAYEKLKILGVTGGVPRYLEEIEPSLSAEENIKNLCFTKGGLLVKEFNNIFNEIFSPRNKTYREIVRIFASGSMELEYICDALSVESSGFISQCLDDLEKSGFLKRDYAWHIESGALSKKSHFRLSDNYLHFYVKYMEKHLPKIENNQFNFKSLTILPGWDAIMALQFENLVIGNNSHIKESLHLEPSEIIMSNPYFQRKTKHKKGCQIDYLIQTEFGGMYPCEIKFSRDPIGIEIVEEVQKKVESLQFLKGYSYRPVLIHVNGVTERVVEADYFARIIDFSNLLDHGS